MLVRRASLFFKAKLEKTDASMERGFAAVANGITDIKRFSRYQDRHAGNITSGTPGGTSHEERLERAQRLLEEAGD
jgi:hypothetical protein